MNEMNEKKANNEMIVVWRETNNEERKEKKKKHDIVEVSKINKQWQNKSQIHQEMKLFRILFTDR